MAEWRQRTMKKIKIKRKIGAYIVIMLIGAVVISSSISASELNKNFVEEKNSLKPIEKQSMANPNTFVYNSIGPGFIFLAGYGNLDFTTGNYNLNYSGSLARLRFIPLSSTGGPAIALQISPTFIYTAGQFNPAGLGFTLKHGGSGPNRFVIGFVKSSFTINGVSYP